MRPACHCDLASINLSNHIELSIYQAQRHPAVRTLGRRSLLLAAVTVLAYALLLVPMEAASRFDLSVFVVAGDHFVNVARLPAYIIVLQDAIGYDGQFFYRFALNPWNAAPTAFGIALDNPVQRMQRILYPVLAWLFSAGRAPLVPASLLFINLAGLGAIAATAAWLVRRRDLAWWLPFAIVLWPGFLVTLTRDTAEIVTTVLLLAALACDLSGRLLPYCVLAAAAALTRETTIPVLLGVVVAEACSTANTPVSRLRRAVLCAVPLVPFGIWRLIVSAAFHQSPLSTGNNIDIGWPLLGVLAALRDNLDGITAWAAEPDVDLVIRVFVVATMCGIVGFCFLVATQIPRIARIPAHRGVAIGWTLTLALASLLTARGPWIEPPAYFRAFTECYVDGCVLLALAPPQHIRGRLVAWAAAVAAAEVSAFNWLWCSGWLS